MIVSDSTIHHLMRKDIQKPVLLRIMEHLQTPCKFIHLQDEEPFFHQKSDHKAIGD